MGNTAAVKTLTWESDSDDAVYIVQYKLRVAPEWITHAVGQREKSFDIITDQFTSLFNTQIRVVATNGTEVLISDPIRLGTRAEDRS